MLKVDVEGHEMSVLQGARQAIDAGRVHVILLEYGDKTSPAIWDTMKRAWGAEAAAAAPQEMKGTSLYSMQRWGDAHGYETFLLGGNHRVPALVPLTGRMWDDTYEVRDAGTAGVLGALRDWLLSCGSPLVAGSPPPCTHL